MLAAALALHSPGAWAQHAYAINVLTSDIALTRSTGTRSSST